MRGLKQEKSGSAIPTCVDVEISAGSKSSHVGRAGLTKVEALDTLVCAQLRSDGANNDFARHPGGGQHAIDIAHARE